MTVISILTLVAQAHAPVMFISTTEDQAINGMINGTVDSFYATMADAKVASIQLHQARLALLRS